MTAYVNDEQKKEGAYGKAVKATLAATLAAGMVPAAAAFADEPAEAAAEDSQVDLLVADGAFANAKVVSATDNAGKEIKPGKDGKFKLAFTGAPHYIKSVTLELADGDKAEVTVENGADFEFKYDKVGDGKDGAQPNDCQAIGEYALKITCVKDGSQYAGQSKKLSFSIEAEQTEDSVALGMVSAVDKDGKPTSITSDIAFANANAGSVYMAGSMAVPGNLAVTVDGEITAVKGVKVFNAADTAEALQGTDILFAGNYVAVVEYGTDKEATVLFTVKPFDLASAVVPTKVVSSAPTTAPDFEITDAPNLKGLLSANYDLTKNDNVPQAMIKDNGRYTFTLALNADLAKDEALAKSITGTKDFFVDFVQTPVTINYGGKALTGNLGTFTVGSKNAFDADEVVFAGLSDEQVEKFASVKVLDAAGKEVSDWSAPGKYTVVAEVNDPSFEFGGSATATFVVAHADASTDGVYVKYNGELAGDSIVKTYDGEDVMKGVSVKVVNGKKTMAEGVDYKLVYTNKAGKEVSEIVDAGEYTLTIKPITFSFTDVNNVVNIKVNQIDAKKLRVANLVTVTVPGDNPFADVEKTGLPYTGSAIVPVIEYTTDEKIDKDTVWATLPADQYSLKYKADGKYVSEMVKEGKYTVEVVLNANAKNYKLSESTIKDLEVIKASRFLDVPSTEWYYSAVNDAAAKGWIKGYSGGDFFGPNDAITRADVCVSLARKAGIKLNIDENAGSEIEFVETPFEDVNGNMYYAQAIAWAAKTGIVTGDSDTGNFRPTDQISRQEFAAMTARFAEKMGKDITADASVLDDYADASAVAGWAKGYVAWAVENGIMGKDTSVLWPTEDITRAAVAAMLVRF